MARKREPEDEQLRLLIQDSVRDLGSEVSGMIADRVLDMLIPRVGAAVERRRDEAALRDAFKEGYLTGQKGSRWNPWHVAIWKASTLYQSLKAKQAEDPRVIAAKSKYADYNYQ